MHRTGDLKLIQELNRYIILDTIRKHGPLSRSEIARKNNFSPTTVTSAVRELIKEGFVYEDGTGASNGGRKPTLVRFSADHHFLIGVLITNSAVLIAEMNMETQIRRKSLYALGTQSGQDVVESILKSLESFMENYDDLSKCIGISIISSGIVDADGGIIRYNSRLGLKDVHLRKLLQNQYPSLSISLENDTNALALAEKNFGQFKDYNNLIYIMIEDGVGAGILVNGTILRGMHGGAGEFGHISVNATGERCKCGNKGCLENLISWTAVSEKIICEMKLGRKSKLEELQKGDTDTIHPATFRQALRQDDQLALEIMDQVTTHLVTGLINLVHLFNPQVIVLAGEMIHNDPKFLENVRNRIADQSLHILSDELEVKYTSLGSDFQLAGAAAVHLHNFFGFSWSA